METQPDLILIIQIGLARNEEETVWRGPWVTRDNGFSTKLNFTTREKDIWVLDFP